MLIGKCIGIAFEGENLRLALVARQFHQYRVLELLELENYRQLPREEIHKRASLFLQRNKAVHCRSVLSVSRKDVIVRQIELPAEAEANLPKVVEYQIASLVPSEDAAICYDYLVSKSSNASKTILVSIILILKSVVDFYLDLCAGLGFKVVRVVPAPVGVANFFLTLEKHFKIGSAVLGFYVDGHLESIGLLNRSFQLVRVAALPESENLLETVARELDVFRSQLGTAENQALEAYLVGLPEVRSDSFDTRHFLVRPLNVASTLGVRIGRADFEGRALQQHFMAVAAAITGLRRRPPLPLNLLPPERQVRKSRWMMTPTYVLVAINVLVALALLLRAPLQERSYSRQLVQEITHLEPEVKKIRSVEKQITDLQRRSELLSSFRKSHSQILAALNELSRILPKDTWINDLTLKRREIEFAGFSDGASRLPQILDNSPFFEGAEFIGSITRDSNGKEVCRIRMTLEKFAFPSEAPKPVAPK
jgi:Tfp pilus assembly protein PilN